MARNFLNLNLNSKMRFMFLNNANRSIFTKAKKINKDFGEYALVQPGNVIINNNNNKIPDFIQKPIYYESGVPLEANPDLIEIKTDEQIAGMKASCKLARDILSKIEINVGMTTQEIDEFVYDLCIKNKAYPSPLNYHGFPKSVCTSVNNVACHGIPDDRKLQNGDIINVDITVYLNGYHGDCSKTFLIGEVDEKGRKLVAATEICLNEAIDICKPGAKFKNIGAVIQEKARKQGFNIIPAFIGHGIGSYFHGPPDIYHFENSYPGSMEAGMTFTIEPILTPGGPEIIILEDNWTAITADNARTAQFEHTVLITANGHEILTYK